MIELESQNDQQTFHEFQDGPLYDLFFGGVDLTSGIDAFAPDKKFLRRLAEDTKSGPILDLCCGTGVFALDLADLGFKVTAVDVCEPMLDWGKIKDLDQRIRWEIGDATQLDLGQKFPLILMLGNAIQAFLSHARLSLVLGKVAKHLDIDGKFAFNMRLMNAKTLSHPKELEDFAGTRNVPPRWSSYLIGDKVVRRTESIYYDFMTQIEYWKFNIDFFEGDQLLQSRTSEIQCRFFSLGEIKLLLERAGMSIDRIIAEDYQTPFSGEGDEVLIVCKKIGE